MMRPAFVVGVFLVVPFAGAADLAPSDFKDYRTAKQALTAKGERPAVAAVPGHLGVSVEIQNGGLHIERVESKSAADVAGIQPGDVIKTVGGRAINSVDALKQWLAGLHAGAAVEIAIERDGQLIVAKPRLQAASNPMRDPSGPRPVLGVNLLETDKGVKVEGFADDSPAKEAGIRIGDVVTRVDGAPTITLNGLRNKLSERSIGERVRVAILRDNKELEIPVPLAPGAPSRPSEDMPTLVAWDERNPRIFRKDTYRLAVIPIAFPDVGLNDKIAPAAWGTALFSTGSYSDKSPTGQRVYGSMNDYYQEISCGSFRIAGKVFEPVIVTKKRMEYTQTANRSSLLTEACDQLTQRDGDDKLKDYDGVFFIYAGNRVQTQRGGIYWPHKSTFRYRGQRWDYFICSEGGERMASISVISHEFGHMLGLPDLYARPEFPGSEGIGIWCTMSNGHGNDGKPLHYSAWCKEQMGWLKPAVIDPRVKQKLILEPTNGSNHECYKVLMRTDGTEYLLLENRVKKGFDRELPAEGLLIWRVVDGKPVLEESHGIAGPEGPRRYLGAVPFPSPSNRSFTPDTTPSSKPSKSGGWPVHITDIRRLEDGRITFQIGFEYL